MILQALKEYYDRKREDPESGMPPFGWEWKEIPYLIVLDTDGNAVALQSTYEQEGKVRKAKSFLLPKGEERTSGVLANLLWDKTEYVIGIDVKGKNGLVFSDSGGKKSEAFLQKMKDLGEIDDTGWNATLKFLSKAPEEKVEALSRFATWKELLADNKRLITFKLDGSFGTVAESEKVKQAINGRHKGSGTEERCRCLITNEVEPVARIHPSIKGVLGGNTSGTTIVGFNREAFCSYGKKQGSNAPVGEKAAFAYTTALNYLLRHDSQNRFLIGGTTVVVWGQKPNNLETNLKIFIEETKDNPDRGTELIRNLFASVKSGAWTKSEEKDRFYILGLSPNNARLAIRFWENSTVKEVSERLAEYFEDINIIHGPKNEGYLSISRILLSLASRGKPENIPPNIEGDLMRAIFEGLPFSKALLKNAIRRNRVEQNVSYPRAGLIKACLNREFRFYLKSEEELKVALDTNNKNIGYRLGRLFAALEKIQTDSGLNSTIRGRYYGAASGTPVTAFPSLMRNVNHHLDKLPAGICINDQKLLEEIFSGISDFPRFLTLAEQGSFAIGYYHQKEAFWSGKNKQDTSSAEPAEDSL